MLHTCSNCGNQYDKAFRIRMNGDDYYFDCFECAISKLAPHCAQCDTVIIGHGVEANSEIYCCGHCAGVAGVPAIVDRADFAHKT